MAGVAYVSEYICSMWRASDQLVHLLVPPEATMLLTQTHTHIGPLAQMFQFQLPPVFDNQTKLPVNESSLPRELRSKRSDTYIHQPTLWKLAASGQRYINQVRSKLSNTHTWQRIRALIPWPSAGSWLKGLRLVRAFIQHVVDFWAEWRFHVGPDLEP